jgi:hypothetical protein
VRAKLKAAEAAGSDYTRNAEALGAVQPEDVLPGDIGANFGAPWIPEDDIRDFAAELFRVPASAIQVGHLPKDAVWSLDAGMAQHLVGKGNVFRVSPITPAGRYGLDSIKNLWSLCGLGVTEARKALPELRLLFFNEPATAFEPFHVP